MAKMGMEVTIVSKGSRALHLILDEVASDMVGAALRANGVKMLSGFNPEEVLAHEQGLVAGANMAGGNSVYRGGVSMNSIEVFKTPVMSIGITNKEHDDYEHESFRDGDIYRKLVFKGDNLIGALLVGDVNHAGILTHLIRSQTDVSEIRDDLLGKVLKKGDLTSLLPVTHNQMAV